MRLFVAVLAAFSTVSVTFGADYKFTLSDTKKYPISFGERSVSVTATVQGWGVVQGDDMTFEGFSIVVTNAPAADVLTVPGDFPKQHVTYRLREPWTLSRVGTSASFRGSGKVLIHFLAMETTWNQATGRIDFKAQRDGDHLLRSQGVAAPRRNEAGMRFLRTHLGVGVDADAETLDENDDEDNVPAAFSLADIVMEVTDGEGSAPELLVLLEEGAGARAPEGMTFTFTIPKMYSAATSKAKELEWSTRPSWAVSGQRISVTDTLTLDNIYVGRTVDVQPIFLKFTDKAGETTGGAHDGVFKQKTIDTWKRAGLTVVFKEPVTVDVSGALTAKHYPTTVSKDEAIQLFFKIDKDLKASMCAVCVKVVYFRDLNCCGGGFSYAGGGIGYIAMNSREAYCDDNNPPRAGKGDLALAHELGHGFGLLHPGSGNAHVGLKDTQHNTLMCGSGFRKNNPDKISKKYKNLIANPAFGGVLTTTALATGDCDNTDTPKCEVVRDTCSITEKCGFETYKIPTKKPSSTLKTYAQLVDDVEGKRLVAHVKHFLTNWYRKTRWSVCVIGRANTGGVAGLRLSESKARAEAVHDELGLGARFAACPSPPLPNVNCMSDPAKAGLHWCGNHGAGEGDEWNRVDIIVWR